ncbi:MAG: hypothetical protein WAW37_09380 [Syntrophobacteraceae bacterium]
MCWLCNDYRELKTQAWKVNRLVCEYPNSYVIVPQDSHVKHHLIVALREHRRGLIDCSADDLTHILESLLSACKALKNMSYKHIYAGCYSDEGHVHFHLIPFNIDIDKSYDRLVPHWLAEKEFHTAVYNFDHMNSKQKKVRLREIEIIAEEVRAGWQISAEDTNEDKDDEQCKCSFCNDCNKYVASLDLEHSNSYVIVPDDPHIKHDLIVICQNHRRGLIDCSVDDLAYIGKSLANVCQGLKTMGYSHIYQGCYPSEGHVLLRLIPFNMGIDKSYDGFAMNWLAEKERATVKCSKEERIREIRTALTAVLARERK